MTKYVARQDGDGLYITEVPSGASVAVGAGATLYETWDDLLVDFPDAEEPE